MSRLAAATWSQKICLNSFRSRKMCDLYVFLSVIALVGIRENYMMLWNGQNSNHWELKCPYNLYLLCIVIHLVCWFLEHQTFRSFFRCLILLVCIIFLKLRLYCKTWGTQGAFADAAQMHLTGPSWLDVR